MTARESGATERAVAAALANPTYPLTEVAKTYEIAVSTLRRAMRRRGHAPRPYLRGSAHPNYRGQRTP